MKMSVDGYMEAYGQDNLPPPWQLFTIPNAGVGAGNLHFVQKIFQGAFEVSLHCTSPFQKPKTDGSYSSMLCSHQLPPRKY